MNQMSCTAENNVTESEFKKRYGSLSFGERTLYQVNKEIPRWLSRFDSMEEFHKESWFMNGQWKSLAYHQAKEFWGVKNKSNLLFPKLKNDEWSFFRDEKYSLLIPDSCRKDISKLGLYSIECKYNDFWDFYDISIFGSVDSIRRHADKITEYCKKEKYEVKDCYTWTFLRGENNAKVDGIRLMITAK